MKGVLVFLVLVAVSACQDEEASVFDSMRESFVMFKLGFDFYMDNNVLEPSTASGFTADVEQALAYVEQQLCVHAVGECDPTDSVILGCNCVNAFQEQSKIECAAVPCTLFSIVKSSGPVLKQLVEEDSWERLAEIVLDNFYIPVTTILCYCPGAFSATATCAADYDGQLFMFMENGTDIEPVYREVIDMLDLDTITEVVETLFTASCGEIDGVNCYRRHAETIVETVRILANSVNTEYDPTACDTIKRHQALFEDYMNAWDYSTVDSTELKKYVNRLVNAFLNMERANICDEDCAEYFADTFYGCCAKHAMEVFSSDRMQRKVMKVLKNVYKLVSNDEKFPNVNKAIKKYYSIYDFEKFCGSDITVYKEVNDMCDAIVA